MKQFIMTIIIVGSFGVSFNASWAANLPQSACDLAQAQVGHLVPEMDLEDGNTAFTYGVGADAFVFAVGPVINFNFGLLFTAQATSTIKIYFMAADCAVSAGYAFAQAFLPANVFSYDTSTGNLVINSAEPMRVIHNAIPRYVWIEVADSYPSPSVASYSYAVDLEDIQNPEDEAEADPEPISEVRLSPDPVIIIPGILGSQDKNGVWLMDPILHTYTDLIETFRINGYVDNSDLFLFPYDWRKSNVETAVALRLRIQEARNLCHCDKVDVVAHSMGGLIAREYIQSDNYNQDIDQVIFLGTPHLGAPKAYMIWEAGEVGDGVADRALKFMLTREGKKQGYPDFLSYVHAKILSVQQLLPIFDYLREVEPAPNEFLESLEQSIERLYNSEAEITNIVGELAGDSTIRYITADNLNIEKGVGDGTVPEVSGKYVNQNSKIFWAVGHSQLPVETTSEVFNILTGDEPAIVSDKFKFPDVKLLILKMLSPADMIVTAPDGKRIGKDFETNQEINEIDGAFYSGFLTDDEYITILNPSEGDYQITTQGTGTGEYTIASAYISEDGSAEAEMTSSTEPGLVEILNFTVSNDLPKSNLVTEPGVASVPSGGGGATPPVANNTAAKVLGASIKAVPNGSLVLDTADNQTIFMIGDGKKHGFVSADVFLGLGFKFEQVISEDLSSYEPGELIESTSEQHPSGSLVWDGQTVWLVSKQSRYGFLTLEQLLQEGFNLSQVVITNNADLNLREEIYAN